MDAIMTLTPPPSPTHPRLWLSTMLKQIWYDEENMATNWCGCCFFAQSLIEYLETNLNFITSGCKVQWLSW